METVFPFPAPVETEPFSSCRVIILITSQLRFFMALNNTHTAKAVDDLYVQNPPSLFGPLTLDLDASSVSKSARSQDDRFCANENTFMTNIPIIATSPVNDLRADRRREQTNTAPPSDAKGTTKWTDKMKLRINGKHFEKEPSDRWDWHVRQSADSSNKNRISWVQSTEDSTAQKSKALRNEFSVRQTKTTHLQKTNKETTSSVKGILAEKR